MAPRHERGGPPAARGRPEVSPTPSDSTTASLHGRADVAEIEAAPGLAPDAETHARQLIEQAGRYVQAALQVPEDLETFRALAANLLFEVALLSSRLDMLTRRLEVAERQHGYRQLRPEEVTIRDVADHEDLRRLTARVEHLERLAGVGR